jgi:hypothetical protein
MKRTQKFGGDWTVEKLNILSDYLDFYLSALKNQKFGKIYTCERLKIPTAFAVGQRKQVLPARVYVKSNARRYI